MKIEFHCPNDAVFKKEGQCVCGRIYSEYSIALHTHDFYEINIVLGGVGIHHIGTADFSVKMGDVFVIPPMMAHAYSNTEHLVVQHILLRKDFVRSNADAVKMPGYLQFMEIETFLRQNYSEATFLHLTPAQLSEIQNDFKFILENGAFNEENLYPLCNSTAWKMVFYFSYLLDCQTRSKKHSKSKYEWEIFDTLEYINSHYSEKISVALLAERVYLSRATFFRKFQDVCGCSPMQYLNQYRTKKAELLLEDSSLSKTEIAHSCGFYDASHMQRNLQTENSINIP